MQVSPHLSRDLQGSIKDRRRADSGVQQTSMFPSSITRSQITVTHLYSPKASSFIGRASESTSFSSLSFTEGTNVTVTPLCTCVRTHMCVVDSPAYLPPLLRLMRQRMSNMRISSRMALMSPISQPRAAKPVGISDGTGRHTGEVTLVLVHL